MSDNLRTLTPILATFLVIIALMTWAFGSLVEKRHNPNLDLATGTGASRSIALEPNRSGSYLAPGRINGAEVTFIIDTGADHVAIPGHLAKRLQLEPGRAMQVITAGGVKTAYTTRIEQIELGGLRVRHVAGSINPSMHGDFVLLGMTFLEHVDFSQRSGRLIIEAPDG